MKKERNSRKEHESRSKRLESELRDMQGTIPENMLQRENLVLRRAVQDLEGNFSKCSFFKQAWNSLKTWKTFFFQHASIPAIPSRRERFVRGVLKLFFISLFMSLYCLKYSKCQLSKRGKFSLVLSSSLITTIFIYCSFL